MGQTNVNTNPGGSSGDGFGAGMIIGIILLILIVLVLVLYAGPQIFVNNSPGPAPGSLFEQLGSALAIA